MRQVRIYVDTSVIGGCCDEEFAQESLRLLEAFRRRDFRLLFSRVVLEELATAPESVQSILRTLPPEVAEEVPFSREIIELRDAYLAAGILEPTSADDATHVAAATVARADAIVAWNFRHIVQLNKIKAYNQVNLAQGYGYITILSPKEVVADDKSED
jgi:predicted nucleic acid-binding protein